MLISLQTSKKGRMAMNIFDNLMYVELSTIHGVNRLTRDDLKDLGDGKVGLWFNRRIKLYDFFAEGIGFDREIAEISGIVHFDVELQIEQSLIEEMGAKVEVIKLEPVEALLVAEADVHLSSRTMTLLGEEIVKEIAADEIILDDDELKFTAAIDIQAK